MKPAPMFVVMVTGPRYGSRDEVCGSWSRPVDSLPAYQTLAFADCMTARLHSADYEIDAGGSEISYYVTSTADDWRRPIARAPRLVTEADYLDDIPF